MLGDWKYIYHSYKETEKALRVDYALRSSHLTIREVIG